MKTPFIILKSRILGNLLKAWELQRGRLQFAGIICWSSKSQGHLIIVANIAKYVYFKVINLGLSQDQLHECLQTAVIFRW